MENNILANQTKERRTKIGMMQAVTNITARASRKSLAIRPTLSAAPEAAWVIPSNRPAQKPFSSPPAAALSSISWAVSWADWIVASMEA